MFCSGIYKTGITTVLPLHVYIHILIACNLATSRRNETFLEMSDATKSMANRDGRMEGVLRQ